MLLKESEATAKIPHAVRRITSQAMKQEIERRAKQNKGMKKQSFSKNKLKKIVSIILYIMEENFKELPKSKYYYICKLCICNHGIKNDFIIQTNN